MRRASTLRYLVGAWITVAAILALAYFFVPESEPLPSQVDAAYEPMPERRDRAGVHYDERSGAEVPSHAPSAAAAVTSTGAPAELSSVVFSAHAPAAGEGRVHGTVRLKQGGLGAGVLLTLRRDGPWGGWSSQSTTSDEEGRYAFADLAAGTYQLAVGGGRAAIVRRVARRGIVLGEEGERRIDLSVEQGGRVWGRVTDRAGQPIPRATVLVGTSDSVVAQLAKAAKQRDSMLAAQSDENGDYAVSGVPLEREWRVWVDKERLAPLLTPPFVLHPARNEVRMDVILLEGTTIRGVVQTPGGEPIPRAEVACLPRFGSLLSPMRRAKTARDARSDDQGRFELQGLPAGDYQLMGFRPGYRVSLKGKPVYPDGVSDIVDVRVVLEPALGQGDHAVFGQVVDDQGRPVEGARVGLMLVSGASFGFGESSSTTDASGRFRFDQVCEGTFLVVVHKEGFRRRSLEGVRVDRPTRVALVPEARVEGRVVFPEGHAPSDFRVRVLSWEPPQGARQELFARLDARTRAQTFPGSKRGEFVLSQVPPGQVLLEASAPGLAPGRRRVRVGEGEAVRGVTLRLSREGAVVAGRVTDSGGRPIAGAELVLSEGGAGTGLLGLLQDGPQGGVARSDEEGRFRFQRLADATYSLQASHPDHAPARLSGLVAQADQPPVRADLSLRSGGVIEGTTRPGIMVTLAGEGYSEVVASDEQGKFRLEKVPPGSYLARAVVTQEDPTQAPEIFRSRVQVLEGRAVQLSLAEAPAGVTVRGKHTPALEEGSLGMVLLLLPGSPSPDPSSLLWEGEPGVNDAEASRYVVGEALLQPDGSYVIHDVPPGRYVLTVYENSLLRSLSGEQARLIERRELRVD